MFETRPLYFGFCAARIADLLSGGMNRALRRVPAGTISSEVQCVRIGWRAKKPCNAISAPSPSQNVICLVFGISANSAPGINGASIFAVAAGVLPRRSTPSSAPQRTSVGTFTFGASAKVSQLGRACS